LAQQGKIVGKVTNSKNNEEVPFANITIEGTKIGTSTDIDGKFEIAGVAPGFIHLIVTVIGFESITTGDIQVINGKTVTVDIPLSERKYELNEVNVTAQKFIKKEDSPVSLRSISISEIENSAGVNRDISKIVQSFPGVAAIPSAGRNDIIVRGGASNESRFYLDDVEFPNINHFATQGASGGTNGILNADFIREINFYSGAFPSNRGNALSGVFDFKQIDGNSEKLKFRGTLGASEVSLTTDGPLSQKSTFIFSLRRSYLSFIFKALGLPFLPTYNDYQWKSRYKINDKNEITIVSVGALDQFRLDTKIKNPSEYQTYILNYLPIYEQWSYTIGGVYKHYREKGYSLIVLSRNMLNNRQYKYLNNDKSIESNKMIDYVSQEIENKFRIENNYQSSNGIKLNYGVNLDYAKYSNNTFQKVFINNAIDTINYNAALDLIKYGIFTQISKKYFSDLLTLSIGIRADGANYDNSMGNPLNQFSPRFSAAYRISEKISINTNLGRYFQLPALTTLGYKNNNGVYINKENNIKYISCDHIIGGLEYQPTNNTRFTLEGFMKLYSNYPFSLKDSISLAYRPADFGVVGNESVSSTNKGIAYGAEFLMQSEFKGNVNVVLSYTYSKSEFEDKTGNYTPSSWDNQHIFIISANKKFKKSWSAALKWRFAGGLPYTPYDLQKSSSIAAWDITNVPYTDYNNVNSKRFKPFHQLDIRVDKTIYFKKSSLKFYMDIQNAYNFKSEEQGRVTNLDLNGNKAIDPSDPTKYLLRTVPSEGSGTILPSIGIIFDF
jgi:outer membrane receptor for ferrienterochelin and colicin